MIVCLCEGVSDGTIRQAISNGCQSVQAIENACGAGTCCRTCEKDLARILTETRTSKEEIETSSTW